VNDVKIDLSTSSVCTVDFGTGGTGFQPVPGRLNACPTESSGADWHLVIPKIPQQEKGRQEAALEIPWRKT
jgi:hypothetical protein